MVFVEEGRTRDGFEFETNRINMGTVQLSVELLS